MIDVNDDKNHKSTSIIEEDISIKDDFDKIDSFLKQKAPQKSFFAKDELAGKEERKQSQLDSKMLNAPIIDKTVFEKSLDVKSAHIDLSRLTYPNLKQIIAKFGFYPVNIRMYMWKFLFSLPNDCDLYNLYARKGIHPFYQNIKERFPIADQKYFRKTQLICSLLSYWSPHIGNVYYLPNLVFPFVKALPWDDLFIFEVLIAFLNSTCDFWFELYPSPPNTHLAYCESVLQKESDELYQLISKQIKPKTVIWRMLMNIFSESFSKENWLSLMDFLITYNHKPEMVLYFCIAFIISKEQELIIGKSINHISKVLFKPMINSTINQMLRLFKSTLTLNAKYSKNQVVKYKPHRPFPPNDYPKIDRFPLDFLKTTSQVRDALTKDASLTDNMDIIDERKMNAQRLHDEFEALKLKEKKLGECYERMLRTEREKAEIAKRELGLILHHKQKVYEELKLSKLAQLNLMEAAVKKSIALTEQVSAEERRRSEVDAMLRKQFEQFDLKNRLMNEELNNYEYNLNCRIDDLLTQKMEEERARAKEELNRLKMKEIKMMEKLAMNEKKIDEDEDMKRKEVDEAVKEYEIARKKRKFQDDIDMYKEQMKNYQIEMKHQKDTELEHRDGNEYYSRNEEVGNPFNPQRSSDEGELNDKEKGDLIEKYRQPIPNLDERRKGLTST